MAFLWRGKWRGGGNRVRIPISEYKTPQQIEAERERLEREREWEQQRRKKESARRRQITRAQRALGARLARVTTKHCHECRGRGGFWVTQVASAERWVCSRCGDSHLEHKEWHGATGCSNVFRAEHFTRQRDNFGGLSEEQLLANWLEEQRSSILSRRDYRVAPLPFTGTGPTKRMARIAIYNEAKRHLLLQRHWDRDPDDFRGRRVLMLAGGEPKHEADLARAVFPGCHVIACDINERAVELAKPHVDLAAHCDVGDFRFAGNDRTPDELCSRYAFINLDFCGLVTSEGIGQAIDRAAHMSSLIATWHSYGRDDISSIRHRSDSIRDGSVFVRSIGWVRPPRDPNSLDLDEHFQGVPASVRDRLLFLYEEIKRSNPSYNINGRCIELSPLRCWSYRDQQMPMLCVLWTTDWTQKPRILPYQRVATSERLFRAEVLDKASTHNIDWVCHYYQVSRAQIAAWKAVETRKRKPLHEAGVASHGNL